MSRRAWVASHLGCERSRGAAGSRRIAVLPAQVRANRALQVALAQRLLAASALALLAHQPGLSIRMLAAGVGLSHAGTVRLVDRMATEGLLERREHPTDGRTRSLYLTRAGTVASDEVLASRDRVIAEGLSILKPSELKILCDIAERVLRNRLEDLGHSYRVCRLCCHERCKNCPVDAELRERSVDRETNDDA